MATGFYRSEEEADYFAIPSFQRGFGHRRNQSHTAEPYGTRPVSVLSK